ncbi:hypothetical protein D3C83_297490 [compost metagenome]
MFFIQVSIFSGLMPTMSLKLLRAAVPTPMMFWRAQCAVWYCVRSFFFDHVSAMVLW